MINKLIIYWIRNTDLIGYSNRQNVPPVKTSQSVSVRTLTSDNADHNPNLKTNVGKIV